MKIFGKEFKTKKELKKTIAYLEGELRSLHLAKAAQSVELNAMKEVFPFAIGQTVYDLQLRNANGKYAKKNASLEKSLINEVVVSEKNYFNLVDRYKKNDVFVDYESAKKFLESVCVK